MKRSNRGIELACLLVLGLSASHAAAQGSLTPPGAPAPTMKTLDQLEPRVPLVDGSPGVSVGASGTIAISQSGSYYLTTNLTVTSGDGITINADGVTVDLRGFRIRSTLAVSDNEAIDIKGKNVSVFNGHIVSGTTYDGDAIGDQYMGPGFDNGIYASVAYTGIRIRNVSVSGCDLDGISAANDDSVVESCVVKTVGGHGVRAGIVNSCTAHTCGGVAINAVSATACRGHSTGADGIHAWTVADSDGYTTGTGTTDDGIEAVYTVQNSHGYSSGGNGIKASTVADSYGSTTATATSADGIEAHSSVQNSYGESYGGSGIRAETVANSYGYASGDGIQASVVSYSHGYSFGSDPSADGIQADIAVGCTVTGGENIGNKYLMP